MMNEAEYIANGLIELLRVRGKEELLAEIIEILKSEQQAEEQQVVVETATALDEGDLANLTKLISTQLGFQPVMIQKVDPGLLGGVKVRIGDMVIDVSLKNRLKQLRKGGS